MTRAPEILVFDSGLGGLTVFREIAKARPGAAYRYLADDAVFPYGELAEAEILARVGDVLAPLVAARQPDVILELNAANQLNDADLKKIVDPWMTLSSVPAVKNRRVVVLLGAAMSVPGPRVAQGIAKMAQALHP